MNLFKRKKVIKGYGLMNINDGFRQEFFTHQEAIKRQVNIIII